MAGGDAAGGAPRAVDAAVARGGGVSTPQFKIRPNTPAVFGGCLRHVRKTVGRGMQEARRSGAVAPLRARSRWRHRWGGRGLRLRDMERRCAGAVVATGLAGGEMGEDLVDDLASSLRERHFRGVSMHAMTRKVRVTSRSRLVLGRSAGNHHLVAGTRHCCVPHRRNLIEQRPCARNPGAQCMHPSAQPRVGCVDQCHRWIRKGAD